MIEEELDLLFAQPLDVERVARHEMPDALHGLCRADKPSRAAAHRLPFLAHRMAVAGRAAVGKDVRLRVRRTLLGHDVEDLRDDVAGALDQHRVADADVPALADRLAVIADAANIVFVVQRRVGYDDTTHGHRLEPRHGRQCARTADLYLDRAQHGRRLLGRELVRGRPAWAARAKPEPFLKVEPVDLVDDAVDVIGQARPLGLDAAIARQHLLDR